MAPARLCGALAIVRGGRHGDRGRESVCVVSSCVCACVVEGPQRWPWAPVQACVRRLDSDKRVGCAFITARWRAGRGRGSPGAGSGPRPRIEGTGFGPLALALGSAAPGPDCRMRAPCLGPRPRAPIVAFGPWPGLPGPGTLARASGPGLQVRLRTRPRTRGGLGLGVQCGNH